MLGLFLPALIAPALVTAAPAPAQDMPMPVNRHFLVYFDYDSTEVTPEAARILAYAVQVLREHPELKVRLSGHTDRDGTAEYNLDKSRRMAASVAQWLDAQGVNATRITTTGYGEAQPRVETEDGIREPLNRRVEIDLVDG